MNPRLLALFTLSLSVGLLASSGCRRKPAPAPAVEVLAAPMFRIDTATSTADLTKLLTDALTAYEDNGGGVATNLNQLVERRFIDRLPVPPPGKTFAIDAQKREVRLVSQ